MTSKILRFGESKIDWKGNWKSFLWRKEACFVEIDAYVETHNADGCSRGEGMRASSWPEKECRGEVQEHQDRGPATAHSMSPAGQGLHTPEWRVCDTSPLTSCPDMATHLNPIRGKKVTSHTILTFSHFYRLCVTQFVTSAFGMSLSTNTHSPTVSLDVPACLTRPLTWRGPPLHNRPLFTIDHTLHTLHPHSFLFLGVPSVHYPLVASEILYNFEVLIPSHLI